MTSSMDNQPLKQASRGQRSSGKDAPSTTELMAKRASRGQRSSGKDAPSTTEVIALLLEEWKTGSPEVQKNCEQILLEVTKGEYPVLKRPLALPPRLVRKLSPEHSSQTSEKSEKRLSFQDSTPASVGSEDSESAEKKNWKRARTSEGRKYWFNEKTKERQYCTPVCCSDYR